MAQWCVRCVTGSMTKMLRGSRLNSSPMITRAPRAGYLSPSLKSFDYDALFPVPFKPQVMSVGFFADPQTSTAPNCFIRLLSSSSASLSRKTHTLTGSKTLDDLSVIFACYLYSTVECAVAAGYH